MNSPDTLHLRSVSFVPSGNCCSVSGTSFNVVYKDADRVEVSFVRLYDPKSGSGVPLNIDKR